MNKTKTFKVIDSPTGKGKTNALINMINRETKDTKRFLIVTPYLDEVVRICSQTDCRQPIGKKRDDIKRLLVDGHNICCTHALCDLFDDDTKGILLNNGYSYTLIVDEEPQIVKGIIGSRCKRNKDNPAIIEKFAQKDYEMMLRNGLITLAETNKLITWNYDNWYNSSKFNDNGIFDSFRKLTESADLYSSNNDTTVIAFTKPDIWNWFESVYVSSYRVKYGYFYSYCQFYNLEVEWYHINSIGEIVLGYNLERPTGLNRIKLYDGMKYNLSYTLSRTWYDNNVKYKKPIESVKSAFRGYLRYHIKGFKANDLLWTVFKDYKELIQGKEISGKRWLPCNKKATNDYKDCTIVAVLCDRYPDTNLTIFFNRYGIKLDNKQYRLNELIQFIWRSNIRDSDSDKDINVYIPHKGMRELFANWLTYNDNV